MAVKTSWAAGDVLLAADLTDTFAAKVAYSLPKNAQTGTTYTFVLADAGKLVTASNASSSTYTIPPQSSVTWAADTVLRVVNYGAGTVTFAGGSGVTVTNTAATLAQYQSAALIRTASDAWTVVPFSGGVSKATVTATTGSPTVDTTSRPGKTIYIFNGSGSLTVGTAGTCEVLVLGGGGSGADGGNGGFYAGGGGGGGLLETTSAYLSSGTITVVVGGGGAAPPNLGGTGYSGAASRVGNYYGVGGGGGGDNAGSSGTTAPTGGSGGGAGAARTGGPGTSGQGNAGGDAGASTANGGGGGGGAGAVGATVATSVGGAGGNGATTTILGTSNATLGGGGGGSGSTGGSGGTGGGGAGATTTGTGTAGSANTGGGGGGAGTGTNGSGAGGSGYVAIVIG